MSGIKYINKLPMYQWHSISQIPKNIFNDVWQALELNQFERYRIGWNEIHSNLFMKTKNSTKNVLLGNLKEIERNIGNIDWIFIGTREKDYIISIRENGNIIETDNKTTNEIFTPNKNIMEYYEWIYKHARTIKIRYLDE